MSANDHPTDLLAVLALDAVDEGTERDEVERHVVACPRCRQELDAMQDVAGALGHTVTPPPERVWTGIAAQLHHPPARGELRPPGPPALRPPPLRARHRPRRAARAMAAVCAAAAVTIAVLSVNLVSSNDEVSGLQAALRDPGRAAVAAALAAPGHRVVALRGGGGATLADVILLPSGGGYLVHNRMAPAPPGSAYELWALVKGVPLPVGLFGAAPGNATFTIASSPRPTALMVTVEPASGSLRPTTRPLGEASV